MAYVRKIYGAPGTGKTTRMMELLTKELETVDVSQIAYISHTRAAREEAVSRALTRIPTATEKDFKYFRTIHSTCYKLLGLPRGAVMRPFDYQACLAAGIHFGTDEQNAFSSLPNYSHDSPFIPSGHEVLQKQALSESRMVPIDEISIPRQQMPLHLVKHVLKRYDEWKLENNKVDFFDILRMYHDEGTPLPIKVMFIDEAQDLSKLQWSIVDKLSVNCERIYIAGDDDQSIYGFIGADPFGFLLRPADAEEVLKYTWRLPAPVWNLSSTLIHKLAARKEKVIETRPHDGSQALFRLNRLPETYELVQAANQGTVMFLSYHSNMVRHMAGKLRREGIPFQAQIGTCWDTECYQMMKLFQKLKNGQSISVRKLKVVMKYLRNEVPDKFKALDNNRLLDFREFLAYGDLNKQMTWRGMLRWDGKSDWALKDIVTAHNRFGDAIFRDEPFRIILSTIHGAKGREADTVYMTTDIQQPVWQKQNEDPDELIRVSYVGVTRAKQRLFVVDPQTTKYMREVVACLNQM